MSNMNVGIRDMHIRCAYQRCRTDVPRVGEGKWRMDENTSFCNFDKDSGSNSSCIFLMSQFKWTRVRWFVTVKWSGVPALGFASDKKKDFPIFRGLRGCWDA